MKATRYWYLSKKQLFCFLLFFKEFYCSDCPPFFPLSRSTDCVKSAWQKQGSWGHRKQHKRESAQQEIILTSSVDQYSRCKACVLPLSFVGSFIKFVLMPCLTSVFSSDLVFKRNSISNVLNKLLLCKSHCGERVVEMQGHCELTTENCKAHSH